MKFADIRDRLLRDLDRPANVRLFERKRGTGALTLFATPARVVEAALGSPGKRRLPKDVVDALVRELLRAGDRHPAELWTAMLVGIFYPGLTELRRRTKSSAHTDDELDQFIFEVFLETTSTWPRDQNRILLRIRQQTEREVFRRIRSLRLDAERVATRVDEARVLGSDNPFEASPQWTADEKLEAIEALVGHRGKRHYAKLQLARLQALRERGPSLRSRVRAAHPGLGPNDIERIYQRIKRQHQRQRERGEPVAMPEANGDSSAPREARPSPVHDTNSQNLGKEST